MKSKITKEEFNALSESLENTVCFVDYMCKNVFAIEKCKVLYDTWTDEWIVKMPFDDNVSEVKNETIEISGNFDSVKRTMYEMIKVSLS